MSPTSGKHESDRDFALPRPRAQRAPTRLKHLPARLQEQLIDWGCAVCDPALRRHVDPALPTPAGLPYAQAGN